MRELEQGLYDLSLPKGATDSDLYCLEGSSQHITNRTTVRAFNRSVLSWAVSRPGEIWVELSLRINGNWTPFYTMGYGNHLGCWSSKSKRMPGYRIVEDVFAVDDGSADGYQIRVQSRQKDIEIVNLGLSCWHQTSKSTLNGLVL